MAAFGLFSLSFVASARPKRASSLAVQAEAPYAKPYGERDPLPEGYGIRDLDEFRFVTL